LARKKKEEEEEEEETDENIYGLPYYIGRP